MAGSNASSNASSDASSVESARVPTEQGREDLVRAQRTTLMALNKIDEQSLLQLTELTLPEIREIQEEVAHLLPAGNLPAMILSGLTQIKGRKLTAKRVRQDVKALLRGIELLPQGLFGLFIAGPATVLYAYQRLLQLAGKDLHSAFPQGTWQFYLEFGLREDTARHANETVGFQQALPDADPALAAAAWVQATLTLLYRYDDLLSTDWRERVMLRTVYEVAQEAGAADQPPFARLVRDWNRKRPYHAPAPDIDYLRHRLETFNAFIQARLDALPPIHREQVQQRFRARMQEDLAAYLAQMTLLAALTPDAHQELKQPIPLWQAAVGFIYHGRTTLLPACRRNAEGCPLCYPPDSAAAPIPLYAHPEGICDAEGRTLRVDRGGRVWHSDGRPLGNLRPPTAEQIQAWVLSILDLPPEDTETSPLDALLVTCARAVQPQLRAELPPKGRKQLDKLRRAPVLINWDAHTAAAPLAAIRRGRRGVGDHALTLFRTEESMVFDQSHIFFDGMWGMAVAEILTDEAIRTYHRLREGPAVTRQAPVTPLALREGAAELAPKVAKHQLPADATAESKGVDMEAVSRLRAWLKQRGVRLTVNDLLLLYRTFHALDYTAPSPRVQRKLDALREGLRRREYQAVSRALDATLERFSTTNPALLIPMDASNVAPRERLFPTTFRNPLPDLPDVFDETLASYRTYRQSELAHDREAFDQARRKLLAYLKAFGEFMDTLKAVTMRGESFNTATLRLLGHLPPAMQNLLDQIPQRISVLNEVVKGNEVFSNVGRVASGTSLRRFISAKDDGETKELVWGVLSDDQGTMHLSLRDFRPFSQLLVTLGESEVADALARDYLDSYVEGLNRFVADLSTLVAAKA